MAVLIFYFKIDFFHLKDGINKKQNQLIPDKRICEIVGRKLSNGRNRYFALLKRFFAKSLPRRVMHEVPSLGRTTGIAEVLCVLDKIANQFWSKSPGSIRQVIVPVSVRELVVTGY